MVSLALYQPDQAGNCGTIFRLSACLNVPVHLIHPCGFTFSSKEWKRSAMDYADYVKLIEHDDYEDFIKHTNGQRKILLTTKSSVPFHKFTFEKDDILLLGRESAGVPEEVHNNVDARVIIPMVPNLRSINIAMSASMVLSEALRQNDLFKI